MKLFLNGEHHRTILSVAKTPRDIIDTTERATVEAVAEWLLNRAALHYAPDGMALIDAGNELRAKLKQD